MDLDTIKGGFCHIYFSFTCFLEYIVSFSPLLLQIFAWILVITNCIAVGHMSCKLVEDWENQIKSKSMHCRWSKLKSKFKKKKRITEYDILRWLKKEQILLIKQM